MEKKYRLRQDGRWTEWFTDADMETIRGFDRIEAMETRETMTLAQIKELYPEKFAKPTP